MLLEEALRALEEEIVDYLDTVSAVIVVPCDVHTVPFAVLHLDVVPHMGCLFLRFVVAENAHARYAEAVAYQLERLGIALTDNSGGNECAEARARELSVNIVICKICYLMSYKIV